MKKLICLILALSLCLGIAACGGNEVQTPTESQNPVKTDDWALSTTYVIGTVAEFMTSAEYQKMLSDFEVSFHDDTARLIVRKPYVKAAVEFYLDDPACHLLILLLSGDFATESFYNNQLTLVYDMDSGVFYDSLNSAEPRQAEKYAPYQEKPQTTLLYIPDDVYTNLHDGDFILSELERTTFLTAGELEAVNKALGTEEAGEGIVYEKLPTEAPSEEAVEGSAEEPAKALDWEISADAPVSLGGAVTVSEQALADIAKTFRSTQRYQETAYEPSNIRIAAAFEYSMPDFEGHDVHVLVIRVDGANTDMWGMSADTFLVDISTGDIWHEGNLDINNWGDFTSIEECFAAILCSPVWEADGIWSEDETRTDLPQSMIDAANACLS